MVFDEAHALESETLRFIEINISRKNWRKYIPDLLIDNHRYDVDGWIDFKKLFNMMSEII